MNGEPKENNVLYDGLRNRMNDLLQRDGMVETDRDYFLSGEIVNRHNAFQICIGRNEEFKRTVCHISRPAEHAFDRLRDMYVVWDDGRSASLNLDYNFLNDDDGALRAPDEAMGEVILEVTRLSREGYFANTGDNREAAEELFRDIKNSIARFKTDLHYALMRNDETGDETEVEVITRLVTREVAIAKYPDLHRLKHLIYQWQQAIGKAELKSSEISDKNNDLAQYALEYFETFGSMPISPEDAYYLSELFDDLKLLDDSGIITE